MKKNTLILATLMACSGIGQAAAKLDIVSISSDWFYVIDRAELRTIYGPDSVRWIMLVPNVGGEVGEFRDKKDVLVRANCTAGTIGVSLSVDRNKTDTGAVAASISKTPYPKGTIAEALFKAACS